VDRGSFREYDMFVEHACKDFGMDKVENRVMIISFNDCVINSGSYFCQRKTRKLGLCSTSLNCIIAFDTIRVT